MPQEKQEKKKCDKAKKSGNAYRIFKAKELRAEADFWSAKANAAITDAATQIAEVKRLYEGAVGQMRERNDLITEIQSNAEHTAGYMRARANDLRAKAQRLTGGYKRHHHKLPVGKRLDAKHRKQGKYWDLLAPESSVFVRPRHFAVIRLVEVGTESGYASGYQKCPIVGVAWNERTPNADIPDAPKSGVYHIDI